ncbi:MAG: zinc-ribbon domain-containing protein [Nitrososphaerales archaeon]
MHTKQEDESDRISEKCKKCGFENPFNVKFCSNCGARLKVITEIPSLKV